jgi:UDP-N-acetylglucosamine 2-epimerase (non-hydrolysing)
MAVKTIDLIVGARPNFVKVAPVYRALQQLGPGVALRLVHTGQHYDVNMSDSFFEQLNIPAPDVSLGVGSGEHGAQTAAIMAAYEASLLQARPALVLVLDLVMSDMMCVSRMQAEACTPKQTDIPGSSFPFVHFIERRTALTPHFQTR